MIDWERLLRVITVTFGPGALVAWRAGDIWLGLAVLGVQLFMLELMQIYVVDDLA